MKKRFKKGVAIETAILLTFVLVALSIFLTTISLLMTNNKNKALNSLAERVKLQTIGEDFLESIKKGTVDTFDDGITEFDASVSSQNGYELTLSKDGERVLYIKVSENNKIVEWQYS